MPDTITIHIPTALRPQTDNKESIAVTGTSVKQVLGSLNDLYPDLGKRLFKTENQINRFINIYLNDEDIRFMQDLDTPVKAGDEVSIVPAIAGG